jgi:hypothetical protein
VRQHCNDYWLSIETESLRKPKELPDPAGSASWCDMQGNLTTAVAGSAQGYAGSIVSPDLGYATARLDAPRTMSNADEGTRVRLLGVRVSGTRDGIEVALGQESEVFWLTA